MKNALTLLLLLLGSFELFAQVDRTIVVEHFTNSRCGICANRNPGFYTNLNNQENVLHISIHPSAPYSNCLLHQHNPTENDSRTNYYGVYGGTPRLVIQGNVISAGANYGSATIFDPYQDQSSDVSIQIYQTKVDDQLGASVVIKAEADNDYGSCKLFLAAVEELINYDAPNGEDEHFDVFRKTLDGNPQGLDVDVPATAGDSVVVTASVTAADEWEFDRMYVMAILQDATTKAVYQAGASDPSDNMPLTNTEAPNTIEASVFPNPVAGRLTIQLPQDDEAQVQVFSLHGQLLQQKQFQQQTELDLADLPQGTYQVLIQTEEGQYRQQLIKQ